MLACVYYVNIRPGLFPESEEHKEPTLMRRVRFIDKRFSRSLRPRTRNGVNGNFDHSFSLSGGEANSESREAGYYSDSAKMS